MTRKKTTPTPRLFKIRLLRQKGQIHNVQQSAINILKKRGIRNPSEYHVRDEVLRQRIQARMAQQNRLMARDAVLKDLTKSLRRKPTPQEIENGIKRLLRNAHN